MAEDRDVRLRVGVEKEGDTDAFATIAEEIGQTEAAAKEAAASVGALVSDLGKVSPSNFHALRGALDDVQKALAQIEKADSFAKQKAGVDALESKLQSVREVLRNAWTEGSAELERYEATLTTVREAQGRFADPLVTSLRSAGEAVDKLATGVAAGSSTIQQSAVQASLQVQRLREEIAATAAAGGDVGRASEALAALETRYSSLVQEAGRFKATQQQVNRELKDGATVAQGYGRSIGSVRDIVQSLSDRGGGFLGTLGKVGLVLGSVTLAFTAGYRAGQKLAEGLDFVAENFFGVENASDRAAGAVNRWIGLTALANKAAGESGKLGLDHAQILDSQRRAFERLNIPLKKFTTDTSANMRLLGEAMQTNRNYADSVRDTANALGLLTDQQLADKAKEVIGQINTLLAEGFDPERIAAGAEGLFEPLLAELDRLPPELQQRVRAIADQLGLLPSAVNEQKEALATAARDLLSSWGAAIEEGGQEAAASAEAVVAAVNQALAAGLLKGEVLDQAREAVKALVDVVRDAGEPLSEPLIAAADATGVFVAAMHRGAGEITVFQGAGEDLSKSWVQVRESTNEAGQSVRTITDDVRRGGQTAAEAKAQIQELQQRYGGLAEDASSAAQATEEASSAADQSSQSTDRSAEATERAAAAAKEQAAATGEAATASEEAAGGADQLAEATERYETAAQGAGSATQEWKDASGELKEPLAAVVQLLADLDATKLTAIRGEISGLLGDLDALILKANQAQAALAAAFAVDDGGAPSAAAPEAAN